MPSVAVDPRVNAVTLQRDGSGSGGSPRRSCIQVSVRRTDDGRNRACGRIDEWRGVGTFTSGIATSDELFVTDHAIITLANGMKVKAAERLYTLVGLVQRDAS
jgi:hypothetical protein